MRVLLVYTNRTRIMEPAPPIGLSYVATATRDAGNDVRFLDLMLSKEPFADLKSALKEFQPEVVGFSIRNIDNIIAQRCAKQFDEVRDFLNVVRENSQARIVIGGPAVSILGGSSLEQLPADFAIIGEGEISFPQLLEAMKQGKDYATINGLCYRDGGTIRSIPAIRLETFGSSGMENWVNWRRYERAGAAWAIHTKRGCPLGCIYCNYPVMEGHRLRRRPVADIVDEIERVSRTVGPRTFEFTDSTFNIPEHHAIEICEEIIRRGLRVNLSSVSINPAGVSRELFVLMKRAGFRCLVITPDSASETMLRNLRKGFDAAQVHRTAELAKESGIRSTWFFLLGGPGETKQTVDETVSFAEQHLNSKRILTIFLTGIRLLPGTPLTQKAFAESYLSPDKNLCDPTFYFSKEVEEAWILYRINKAIGRCPTIVHGAEQNGSPLERAFNHALYWLGVAPPYYRFLSTFLSIPPIPKFRARGTGVRATCLQGASVPH